MHRAWRGLGFRKGRIDARELGLCCSVCGIEHHASAPAASLSARPLAGSSALTESARTVARAVDAAASCARLRSVEARVRLDILRIQPHHHAVVDALHIFVPGHVSTRTRSAGKAERRPHFRYAATRLSAKVLLPPSVSSVREQLKPGYDVCWTSKSRPHAPRTGPRSLLCPRRYARWQPPRVSRRVGH
jgi:hypothetical protein